jgi:hypothetical protein
MLAIVSFVAAWLLLVLCTLVAVAVGVGAASHYLETNSRAAPLNARLASLAAGEISISHLIRRRYSIAFSGAQRLTPAATAALVTSNAPVTRDQRSLCGALAMLPIFAAVAFAAFIIRGGKLPAVMIIASSLSLGDLSMPRLGGWEAIRPTADAPAVFWTPFLYFRSKLMLITASELSTHGVSRRGWGWGGVARSTATRWEASALAASCVLMIIGGLWQRRQRKQGRKKAVLSLLEPAAPKAASANAAAVQSDLAGTCGGGVTPGYTFTPALSSQLPISLLTPSEAAIRAHAAALGESSPASRRAAAQAARAAARAAETAELLSHVAAETRATEAEIKALPVAKLAPGAGVALAPPSLAVPRGA